MAFAWYFAYGSNMQRATFSGRRGISYNRALAARIAGWRIAFDKMPLFPIGESFATLVADPHGEALGVLYEIGAEELAHVELTEGVLIGNYERATVTATPLLPLPEKTVNAVTLVSSRRREGMRPSRRYMDLLIEGAREHQLPESYVAFLRAVPAQPDSARSKLLRPLIDAAMRHR